MTVQRIGLGDAEIIRILGWQGASPRPAASTVPPVPFVLPVSSAGFVPPVPFVSAVGFVCGGRSGGVFSWGSRRDWW